MATRKNRRADVDADAGAGAGGPRRVPKKVYEAELLADPGITQARFEVEAEAGPGAVTFRVSGRDAPVGADPVDYTAFSLMRLLRRRQAPLAV